MTKHCRKEHPSELGSDEEVSDQERQVDRTSITSSSSSQDCINAQAPRPVASAYDAKLWRLPAQATSTCTTPNSTSGNEMSHAMLQNPSQNYGSLMPQPYPYEPAFQAPNVWLPPNPAFQIMPPPMRRGPSNLAPSPFPSSLPQQTLAPASYMAKPPQGFFEQPASLKSDAGYSDMPREIDMFAPMRTYGMSGFALSDCGPNITSRMMSRPFDGSIGADIDIFKELKADAVYGQLPEHSSYDI